MDKIKALLTWQNILVIAVISVVAVWGYSKYIAPKLTSASPTPPTSN